MRTQGQREDTPTPHPPVITSERDNSYTTPRSDVFEMVPAGAREVLDVGCSNGTLGLSLRNAVPGRSVSGIEFDESFAREAAAHLDYVVHADLNTLDWKASFAQRSFDCMIFADVLEHLREPERCLSQALPHLKPGGCVVVSLPNIRHLSALWAVFIEGQFPRRDRGIFDGTHLRWFTLSDAHALLDAHGLTVSSTRLALRWGDRGGGRINRFLNRLPPAVQQWFPVREFLTYQMVLRADLKQER